MLRGGLKPHTAGRLVQEYGRGLVNIKIDGGRLLLTLPEPQFREPTEANLAAVADGLGVSVADVQRAAIIDVGPSGSRSSSRAAMPSSRSHLTWASSRR
jgi:predicted PhzF superfamily epimerase YddE/YHI9